MLIKPKKARKNPNFVSDYRTKYLARNYTYEELLLFDGQIPSYREYVDARREIEREQKSPAIF